MLKKLIILIVLFCVSTHVFGQSVDTAWVRTYDGPANSYDVAKAIAVNDSGNVYVTGDSYGNETSHDYATIKYYPNGDTAWIRRYNGPGNGYDGAYAMEVDSLGNVYVTGASVGSGTFEDYATIKYFPNGDTAWVRRYNGPANSVDRAYALSVDDYGDVYVTGSSGTIKYDASGNQLWFSASSGIAMTVDGSGNAYVTGTSAGNGTSLDYVTVKYHPNGDTAWVRRYNGPVNGADAARAIAADGSGNAYVTGWSQGSGIFEDYATIKYYPNGDTAWVRRYDSKGNNRDWPSSIAVDDSGDVFVTGYSPDSGTGYLDYTTIKYYPNGDTAWVRRYNGSGNSDDVAYALVVDGKGNAFVTGGSRDSAFNEDYTTVKYHPNGDLDWITRYRNPGYPWGEAYDISVDSLGNVYVTGATAGSGTSDDYTTIKYVQFLRGDADHDKNVNIADIVYLVSYLFKRGPAPLPILQVGDANCDAKVTIADIVYLVAYLFKSGPAPCI